MKSFDVLLSSVSDVRAFAAAAGEETAEIDVVSGRYIIDAKSIMGLFSLDLSSPVRVEVSGGEEEFERFKAAVSQYVVG